MSAGGEPMPPAPIGRYESQARVDVICSRRLVSKALKWARMVLQSDRAATAESLRKVESAARGPRECLFGK
jgi:hypothetical protein